MTGSRSRSGRAKADVDFLSRPSSEQKTRGPLPRVLHEARPRGEPVRDHAAAVSPCEQGAAGSLGGGQRSPLV